jgi:hypothetical protein
MKVNRLPSILKGGGGRDKGGTEKEGGRTGRGDIQTVVGGWSLSVGAHCPQALVIRGRGRRLSAGVCYSWAGSSLSEGDRCCPRGIVVVRGGSLLSAVGGHPHPWAQRCLSYVGGGSLVLYGGSAVLVVCGGVVIVYRGSLWVRGGSLWPRVSVGGCRPWVGGRRCAWVGSLSVCACVGGRPHSWALDRCSGAVIVGGGRSLSWCVCVAVYVARLDGPSTCHVSSSVVAPFVGRHRCQHALRSSFL